MCGGWVEKREVSVLVMEVIRMRIWGGRVMVEGGGGAFSLLLEVCDSVEVREGEAMS